MRDILTTRLSTVLNKYTKKQGALRSLFLYQIRMILYRQFDFLWFYTDIPLRSACVAMLKEPLHKCYIIAIGIVDLRCVPLAEAVGTATLVPQVIAHDPQLFLYCPFCDGKDQVSSLDPIAQTVIFDVLPN